MSVWNRSRRAPAVVGPQFVDGAVRIHEPRHCNCWTCRLGLANHLAETTLEGRHA